ncbi:MAG: phage antirepressor KilAC domain-containing protein [Firmicutes bacterium]|nr:phage antirepressor KilAC domain-containing protein [Bacillota bacterium]
MSNLQISIIDEREVLGKPFRIFGDAENPLFLAKDVAAWIGIKQTGQLLEQVDQAEKLKCFENTSGQRREMWFLTEDGLYEVLMQSRKPIAKEFKRQVKAILKQIRRTGGYIPIAEDEPDEIIMARALLIMQKTLEDKDRIIDALLPKAEFADAVTASNACVSFGEMAKILRQNGLPYGRTRMCEALRRDGFLIRQDCVDYNTPTQYAMERGVFYHCKHVKDTPGGFQSATNVTRVTGRGQQVLLQHFMRKQVDSGGSVA